MNTRAQTPTLTAPAPITAADETTPELCERSHGSVSVLPLRSPRVDIHRHLWPEELVAVLAARSSAPCLAGSSLVTSEGRFAIDPWAHGASACVSDIDSEGIDVAVISLQPTLGTSTLPANEAAEIKGAYDSGVRRLVSGSNGRLRAFSSGGVYEGFVGLCVAADELSDLERLAPSASELVGNGQILFVHPGPAAPPRNAPSWWAPVVDYTAQMQSAFAAWVSGGAARWPTLRVVFAILAGGALFQLERLSSRGVDVRRLGLGNVYFDTASYGRLSLELCLAASGVEHIVYGSDAPVIDANVTLAAVNALGKVTADAICRKNPASLLKV
jgi:hypothetical protein